jgi:hypothetical protein
MAALFPRWSNTAARASLLALALLVVGVPLGLMAFVRSSNASARYEPVPQPIPFDHQIHAGRLGISCEYCHTTVMRSPTAGIPPTQTCVPCHSTVWINSRDLAPVRRSMQTGKPIAWNRVDRLPDFVYFDHSVHVNKGVGCESCHGRVDQMSTVYQAKPLTMGWCLSCHRMPAERLRPVEAVTVMGYTPAVAQARLGPALAAKYHVRSLTSCTTCHR